MEPLHGPFTSDFSANTDWNLKITLILIILKIKDSYHFRYLFSWISMNSNELNDHLVEKKIAEGHLE